MEKLTFNQKLSRFFINWVFMMLLWIGFTGSFAGQELIVGIATTAVISFFTIRFFTCCTLAIFSPVRIYYMIVYLFVFTWELIKSNIDVARRVLTPSLPINPGIVKFKTNLTSNYSRMILANSITLTPGTLTIDVIDDTYYIHWIDVTTTNPEEAYVEIAEKFEKILMKIF